MALKITNDSKKFQRNYFFDISGSEITMRKHLPATENYMKKVYPEHTICQQLRELYHMTNDPEIKMGLRVAVSMAKAMQRKLKEYNTNWQKGFWDES